MDPYILAAAVSGFLLSSQRVLFPRPASRRLSSQSLILLCTFYFATLAHFTSSPTQTLAFGVILIAMLYHIVGFEFCFSHFVRMTRATH